MLRWAWQLGLVILPKSKTEKYIRENLNILDFALQKDEIASIDALNQDMHTCWNPSSVTH